jgi:hypothetical protein
LVTTFGPGALIDMPNHSALVGGLDTWSNGGEQIFEPRLLDKLRRLLDLVELELYSPPPDQDDDLAPPTGITAWQFPEWFITQDIENTSAGGVARSRLLVHRTALNRGKYVDFERRRRPVVPVRFVRACRRGHIGDIDWYPFVHGAGVKCRRQLFMDERGTSGDLSEVWVRCECGEQRPVSHAARMEMQALGHCDGSRPWLGPYTREACGEPSRLLVRSASNAYFGQVMSVISIPERDEDLVQAVNQVWENFLQYVETIEELRNERRRKPPVGSALKDFSDEAVFEEIQVRKGTSAAPTKSVKQAEFEILSSSRDEVGQDRPDGDFYARALPVSDWVAPHMAAVERVVLVHRLREVTAQVGFTRFEPSAPDIEGELEMGVTRAALARETTWLPAVENRGEGIFLAFKKADIEAWLRKPAVVERGTHLSTGFDAWLHDHQGSRRQFAGLPYLMLHSFSHMLITAVSLDCGYPASSIRERVYAGSAGYGILLFTGSPDAEGTLGGLVEVGRQIGRHFKAALELGQLCSNDPVCAQHQPQNLHERRFLLGAACHSCLLIAETCCEQHNDFLDRALVVPTVEAVGTEFFRLDGE